MKSLLVVALLVAAAVCAQSLNLTVHTTSGCTDTVWFIQTQLIPTYAQYGQFIDLRFVPWGRTVRVSDGSLTCQFGAADCWANRLHRCALHLLSHDQDARLTYMNCEFRSFTDRPAFQFASKVCAEEARIPTMEIEACMETEMGDDLADVAQAEAFLPMQVINFVPAIEFNGSPSSSTHSLAFQNLAWVVCNFLSLDSSTGVGNCDAHHFY